MSIQRLGDFLGKSYDKGYLQRIYVATQLERLIKKEFSMEVSVSVRQAHLIIYCNSQAAAVKLRASRRRLYGVIKGLSETIYRTNPTIQIRLRRG